MPDESDELDKQARRLLRMLLGEEDVEASTPRPHSKDRRRYSTMGSPYSPAPADEPVHPVIVACRAWMTALQNRDAADADESAHALYALLQPYAHRPLVARMLGIFRFSDALDARNLPPLTEVLAFFKASE